MKKKEQTEITKRAFLREWLEKLQQESWQLELLISGFALFGIYEGKSWIEDLALHFDTFSYSTTSAGSKILTIILEGGWTIFFINLLTHVILRGLWIGAIGLRYVSEDIEYDRLDFSPRFTDYLKKKVGDYDDFIERLEKICSVLFAYTFLLFLLLVSLLMFFLWLTIFQTITDAYSSPGDNLNGLFAMLMVTFFVLGLLVFVDFVTLGAFKKIREPNVSRIYMYIYRFYSFITLSFLYRALLYNFIDNKYTRRLFFLSIPYIFLILFAKNLFTVEAFPHWSSSVGDDYGLYVSKMQYEDERKKWYSENNKKRELEKHELPLMTLSQWMVDEPYLEIFIKLRGNDQYLLEEIDSIAPFSKPGFRFSLFSSDNFKDKGVEELKAQRSKASKIIRDARKTLIKQRMGKKNTGLDAKIDSLENAIDEVRDQWDDKIDLYQKDKVENTMATMLKHTRVSLDEVPIDHELDCYLYKHPNFNEVGYLCLYNTDSLSVGKHLISLERDIYRSANLGIRTLNRKVPFYKVK